MTKYALNDSLNCKEPDPWYYQLADSILREKFSAYINVKEDL
jgi:hypothetical protein